MKMIRELEVLLNEFQTCRLARRPSHLAVQLQKAHSLDSPRPPHLKVHLFPEISDQRVRLRASKCLLSAACIFPFTP